jgi:hypothetical protein
MTTPHETLVASPGPSADTVRTPDGQVRRIPDGWVRVPPGDPGLTRRVKAAGPSWTVQEKRGRKVFSRGVYVPAETVERITAELAAERSTAQYAKRKAADARRRDAAQTEYVGDFRGAVLSYLAFAPAHADLAAKLADAVTAHATPVGSGTVARTERIPIDERAAAAVLAWMRHQTTAYDSMTIARVKGKRREVRRMLAARSKALLDRYRTNTTGDGECPLRRALAG